MKLLPGIGWSFRQRKDTAERGWMAARKLFLISFPAEKRAGSFTAGNTNDLMAGLPADAKFARLIEKLSIKQVLELGCIRLSANPVADSS
jgi:hypothetical protein